MTAAAHRILVNSLPKSGTHLLAKAVEVFGYREHFADSGGLDAPSRVTPIFLNYREVRDALARDNRTPCRTGEATVEIGSLTPIAVDAATLERWLGAVAEGCYLMGHLPWSESVSPLLARIGYRHLFIIRDPRAVAVSLLDFILDTRGMPRPHFLQEDFREMSPGRRLEFLLAGGQARRAGVETQGLSSIYREMWAWHDDPDCLVVRYEDLVGVEGGGSEERQRAAMARIAAYLGQPARQANLYDSKSRTFRQGRIDGWKEALDPESLERLTDYCAPLCRMAGYPE